MNKANKEALADLLVFLTGLAVGAVIMIVGIGGNIGYSGGFLPIPAFQSVFPSGLPAIATAAVLGILLNAIFLVFEPPKS